MTSPLPEPFARFDAWWRARRELDPSDVSSAMVLSSVDERGRPSSRVVLLRGFDARGFAFYTNLESKKGRELLARPFAALNFHWPAAAAMPTRQVRVEGAVVRVDDAESDAYFASRARESQLGAWASAQSRTLESREVLLARFAEVTARFEGGAVPRPPYWGGLRVIPDAIELWQDGAHRLHDRTRWDRNGGVWTPSLLFP